MVRQARPATRTPFDQRPEHELGAGRDKSWARAGYAEVPGRPGRGRPAAATSGPMAQMGGRVVHDR